MNQKNGGPRLHEEENEMVDITRYVEFALYVGILCVFGLALGFGLVWLRRFCI